MLVYFISVSKIGPNKGVDYMIISVQQINARIFKECCIYVFVCD